MYNKWLFLFVETQKLKYNYLKIDGANNTDKAERE